MSRSRSSEQALVRGLGLAAATSVVVGSVIGTGIFLKTRVMMCNVESPTLVIVAWLVAGLLSLAGALTYAELAAMMPRAGGEYVFIREGYGRPLAFLADAVAGTRNSSAPRSIVTFTTLEPSSPRSAACMETDLSSM